MQSKAGIVWRRREWPRYHNRAIATQEVIEELIKLAMEMDAATKRGEDLGLNEDEIAFYDVLAANESAVKRWATMNLKS